MVPGQEQFKNILSRIKGFAPCSVIIENDSLSDGAFVDGFLSEEKDVLMQSKIFPVRVDCAQYDDTLDIWKAFANAVKEGMPNVFPGNSLTQKYFARIESTEDTDDVQSYLIHILNEIKIQTGWYFLLIIEHLEKAIDVMPDYDNLKMREMTDSIILMVITRSPLEGLCEKRYQNVYFANQFVEPSFVK